MTRRTTIKTTAFAIAAFVLVCLTGVPRGFAQFSSGFTGIVVDQTGAVVVGAKVTVTNEATQVSNAAVSNDSGNFGFHRWPEASIPSRSAPRDSSHGPRPASNSKTTKRRRSTLARAAEPGSYSTGIGGSCRG